MVGVPWAVVVVVGSVVEFVLRFDFSVASLDSSLPVSSASSPLSSCSLEPSSLPSIIVTSAVRLSVGED